MDKLELILVWRDLLRVTVGDVVQLIRTAPYQYRHYTIDKRNGGKRDIHHPTPSLKMVQRWLVLNVFSSLRVHPSVYSYRKGRNIRAHAEAHLHSNFLLRLDFENFFPSIDSSWVRKHLEAELISEKKILSQDALQDVLRLVCRCDEESKVKSLSVGAPSSPLLSNALLFDLDDALFNLAKENDCVYTRYADDIFISSREAGVLGELEVEARKIVKRVTPKLAINEAKTLNVSRKKRRVVTGVTLTPDRELSVGRDLKRSIRSRVFLSTQDGLSSAELESLSGLLAFVRDVEPSFIDGLIRKFGFENVEPLLTYRRINP